MCDPGETMRTDIREELKRQLVSRGFRGPESPNRTMTLDDDYLAEIGVGELMKQLVARREKVFRSADVVGMAEATKSYEDVASAVCSKGCD